MKTQILFLIPIILLMFLPVVSVSATDLWPPVCRLIPYPSMQICVSSYVFLDDYHASVSGTITSYLFSTTRVIQVSLYSNGALLATATPDQELVLPSFVTVSSSWTIVTTTEPILQLWNGNFQGMTISGEYYNHSWWPWGLPWTGPYYWTGTIP